MTIWRRLLALIAATAASLLIVCANTISANATAGALYGIAISGAQQSLVMIDPASGTTSPVANLTNILPAEDFLGLVDDPDTRSFYAVVSSCSPCDKFSPVVDRILTVRGSRPSLSPVLDTSLAAIAFDPVTGLLWAMTACFTCTDQSLVTVDPATGTESGVVVIPGAATSCAVCSVAISPTNRKLFVSIGAGGIFTVDMQTHALSGPVKVSSPLTEIAFDVGSQNLVGLGNSFLQQFDRVDPSTGTETALFSVPFNHTAANIAIDPALHTAFFVELDSSNSEEAIVSIDDVNGTASTGSVFTGTTVGLLVFMEPAGRRVSQSATALPAPRSSNNPDSPGGGPGVRRSIRQVIAPMPRHVLTAIASSTPRTRPGQF